ncbi:hypothetical protein [Streptomyces sp. NPDC056690]|uniref:hypothetical protein n=1 Tax=unclassified Streptomyces TaxID=2593676 RepID=UPI00362A0AEC
MDTLILVLLDPDKADLMGLPGRASTGADRGSVAASGSAWGSRRRRGVGLFRARGQRVICGLDTGTGTGTGTNLSRTARS